MVDEDLFMVGLFIWPSYYLAMGPGELQETTGILQAVN